MFGIFQPRPPLNLRERTWVELRMQWLAERLGFDRLRSCEIITPSDAHFPEAYSGSDEDIERIFARLCDLIGVRRETVELILFNAAEPRPDGDGKHSTALGIYQPNADDGQPASIWIEASQSSEPTHLIATTAHELSHQILLGSGLLTDAEADHEFVTDLLPVARGLGIFSANAAVAERTESSALTTAWRISKRGYLPARMFGYALAVFAWLRDDKDPSWARYLRADARDVMQAGLKYLHRTNDCVCRHPRTGSYAVPTLLPRLKSENPGTRLAALWELRRPESGEITAEEWQAVADCLDHRDSVLQCEAALTIAALDRADPGVAEKCLDLLAGSAEDSVLRSALALALGTQRNPTEAMIYDLTVLLDDESERVVAAALTALRRFGPIAAPIAIPKIVEVLRWALLECNGIVLTNAAAALRAIDESPRDRVMKQVGTDPELRGRALHALRMDIAEGALVTACLPTPASLPVPLPDWNSIPPQVIIQHTLYRVSNRID